MAASTHRRGEYLSDGVRNLLIDPVPDGAVHRDLLTPSLTFDWRMMELLHRHHGQFELQKVDLCHVVVFVEEDQADATVDFVRLAKELTSAVAPCLRMDEKERRTFCGLFEWTGHSRVRTYSTLAESRLQDT